MTFVTLLNLACIRHLSQPLLIVVTLATISDNVQQHQ